MQPLTDKYAQPSTIHVHGTHGHAHLGEVLNVLQDDRFVLRELLVDVGVLAAAPVVRHVPREEVGEGDGGRPIACA